MVRGETILVVDDDESIVFALVATLESEGYFVETAKNGYEALSVLQDKGIPNLILLDMKMPEMNGWEFAAEFNARHDHKAPIVVMTAAVDAQKRAKDIHAAGWLGKPFHLETLTSTVRKYARHAA